MTDRQRLLNNIRFLRNYYHRTRGAGHTRLMLEGLKNYSGDAIALATSHHYAVDLAYQAERVSTDGHGMLDDLPARMVGRHTPVAIDNSAMMDILYALLDEITYLRQELVQAHKRV